MLQRWLISAAVDLAVIGAVLLLMLHGELPTAVGASILAAIMGARARAFLDSGNGPPPPPALPSGPSAPSGNTGTRKDASGIVTRSGAGETAIGALVVWLAAVLTFASSAVAARASPPLQRLRHASA